MTIGTLPLLLVCAFASTAFAHTTHHLNAEPANCSAGFKPVFDSYHIHFMFWGGHPVHVAGAMELQWEFMKEFDLLGKDNCTGFTDQKELCAFETDFAGDAPFTQAQFAFYIPTDRFMETVLWTMQNRGIYDVFIHPNSACYLHDHTVWSVEGGNQWPLDTSIFN